MKRSNNLLSYLTAGLVAVIVGFTSSVALIYQMVLSLGGDATVAASWLLALGIAMGFTSIGLSLYYRIPILIAWSTPGAALLIAGTQGFTLNQAVGAFICSAILILLSGLTGWFEKLMNRIPLELACAMLAGVLVNFGINVFDLMAQQTALILAMVMIYLLTKQLAPRFSMLAVLLVGFTLAWQGEQLDLSEFNWAWTTLNYVDPEWSLAAFLSISLPLFIVTMASQNLPGIAVLQAHQYHPPVSAILRITGLANVLIAPFGGFALNLAAISAAICMSPEAGSEPNRRYWSTVAAGAFYILMGLGAASLMSLFVTMPQALIMALAGIALFSTIAASLKQALATPGVSEAAIITFLVTASDLQLWNISSALWGLVAGLTTLLIQQYVKGPNQRSQTNTAAVSPSKDTL